MQTLSSKEETVAKTWMYNICYWSGLENKSHGARCKVDNWQKYQDACAAAKEVVAELINRNFTFINKKLDDKLAIMAELKVSCRSLSVGVTQRSAAQIAEYIGWFCDKAELVWDDSNLTPYELEAIQDTILGKALIKWGCFNIASAEYAKTTQAAPAASTAPGKTAGQPANSYKQTGAHSADIPNLIGNPNNKISLTAPLFAIEADKLGKNVPNAYITPLKATNTGVLKVTKVAAEAVHFGSGNGYTDCKLWFTDYQDAEIMCDACIAAFGSKYKNIRIVKYNYTDKNGFFNVTTCYGPAYIKAVKLNEELDACLEELAAAAEEPKTDELTEATAPQQGISKLNIFSAMAKAKEESSAIDLDAFEEGMRISRT